MRVFTLLKQWILKILDIKATVDNIGEVYTSTKLTTSVPTGKYTDIAQLTLPAGVYVIEAAAEWTTSVSSVYNLAFVGTDITRFIRASMVSGGGATMTCIVSLEEESNILTMRVYQGTGSTRVVQSVYFKAVRIK